VTPEQALLLGVIQGLTEFLPISSSGHLALMQQLMPGITTPFLLFEVVVHMGTLCAIVLVLRARIVALLRAGLSLLPGVDSGMGSAVERRWIGLIVLASLPTAAIGLLLRAPVEAVLHDPVWVGAALLVTAALLVASERVGSRSRGPDGLGVADALVVGVAQGLAVVPGISRSGATVAAALTRGVRADAAVEFSLLISLPAVVGATLLVVLTGERPLGSAAALPLAIGFVSAFATGVAALRALQWAVAKRKLMPFAVYCGLLGVGAIAVG
jgi:undecaprenyl-diphosphatase